MENLITSRQRDAEFFGGMDYATRRTAVEAAHAEALELNEQRNDWQPEVELTNEQLYASMTREKDPEAAHAEALEMDKQITHFRKEQAALSQHVAAIMGKAPR